MIHIIPAPHRLFRKQDRLEEGFFNVWQHPDGSTSVGMHNPTRRKAHRLVVTAERYGTYARCAYRIHVIPK